MAISGQQIINIGLPNESIGSDSLYTAFTKIEQNFTTVFDNASPYNTFIGGTGIGASSNTNTGTVTITNTGVTNIIAGTNIVVDKSNGNVTISATGGGGGGGGTVTSVGLAPISTNRLVVTNSPVISSGTINIDLVTTGVSAGAYSNPNMSIDAYGRVTAIANGSIAGTVTSVGLTAGPGVQVNGGPVTTSGNIVVTNTGVIRLTAGNGIDLSGSNGNVTVSLSGAINGTVTSVGISSTSLVVTGGPITTSGTIVVNLPANPIITGNLTTANANLGTLAKASYFQGDGSNLVNIQSANIVGTVATATVAARVTSSAQPNITSIGTLTSLAVVSSANPSLGNTVTANYFTGSGENLSSLQAANIVGTVASASNATRVSTTLAATGTYYVPFISATTSANYSLNSNAAFTANLANGALIATTFVGNLSGVGTGTPTLTSAGNLNITAASAVNMSTGSNVNVTGVISASGNVTTGSQLVSTIATGTAPFVVSSTTLVANLNSNSLQGNVPATAATANTIAQRDVSGNLSAANFIGNIANGNSSITIPTANGNININAGGSTSELVITSTGINVAGTFNVSGVSNLGPNGNVIITGGSTGQYLQTNGSGGLSWVTIPFGSGVANGTSNISIPAVNGNVNTSVAGNANILVVTGTGVNVAGTLNATGNATVGNLGFGSGVITGTGNITGSNLAATSYFIRSINTAVSATGTNQGSATELTKEINVVSTVASGAGVVLPTAVAGMVIIINNTSANTLAVYPASGGVINSGLTNAAYSHISGASLQYYAINATQWYTVGASYA
jgi:hypothetical protein